MIRGIPVENHWASAVTPAKHANGEHTGKVESKEASKARTNRKNKKKGKERVQY